MLWGGATLAGMADPVTLSLAAVAMSLGCDPDAAVAIAREVRAGGETDDLALARAVQERAAANVYPGV